MINEGKQVKYIDMAPNTTKVREELWWYSVLLLAAVLTSVMLSCASEYPEESDAQRHETPTETETPTSESEGTGVPQGTPLKQDLSKLLNIVPSGFSDDTLVFSFNDPDHGVFSEGRAIPPEISMSIGTLNEMLGLDFRSYEQGIWSLRPVNNPLKTFMAIQGPIVGQQTTNKLTDLDFRKPATGIRHTLSSTRISGSTSNIH